MPTRQSNPKRKRGRPRKKLEDKLSKVLTTDKQKAFLRNRLAGMTKRRAAIQAGYAPSTASIMAKRLTDKLSCNRIFIEEMERQGFTVSSIVSKLKELLECMHPKHQNRPDNIARLKALEMALKLIDAFPSKKVKVHETEVSCELTVDDWRQADTYAGEEVLKEVNVAEGGEDPTRQEEDLEEDEVPF